MTTQKQIEELNRMSDAVKDIEAPEGMAMIIIQSIPTGVLVAVKAPRKDGGPNVSPTPEAIFATGVAHLLNSGIIPPDMIMAAGHHVVRRANSAAMQDGVLSDLDGNPVFPETEGSA